MRRQLTDLHVENKELLKRLDCVNQEKDNLEISFSKAWEEADQVVAVAENAEKELQDMWQESSDWASDAIQYKAQGNSALASQTESENKCRGLQAQLAHLLEEHCHPSADMQQLKG